MFLLLAFVFMILSWIFVLKIDVFDTKATRILFGLFYQLYLYF